MLAAGALAWLTACGARPGGSPDPLGDPCVFQVDPAVPLLDTVQVVLAELPLIDGDSGAGDRFVSRLLAPDRDEADCRGMLRRSRRQGAPFAIVAEPGEADTRLVRKSDAIGPSTVRVRRSRSDADLRDQLDGGADLVFTIDAQAIAYAEAHPDFALLPTGARRSYYLVSLDGDRLGAPTEADRIDLASRAVRGPAVPLTEDGPDAACAPGRAADGDGRRSVVAYLANDQVARQLAERIAALSAGEGRPRWVADLGRHARAEPIMSVDALRRVIARGEVAAAVAPGTSLATVRCLVPLGARVASLVAVTGAVIIRRGVPPVRWIPGQLVGFETAVQP